MSFDARHSQHDRRARAVAHEADALLVNTARGGLIDSAALVDALRTGKIGGAAIDVLPQEPPLDGNPLVDPSIPNLILTPHIAWAAREARSAASMRLRPISPISSKAATRNRVA